MIVRWVISVVIVGTFCAAADTAAAQVGTIDPVDKWAWSENIGWLNFNATTSNVMVSDSALTGYVWSESHSWIDLAPTSSGVTNTTGGVLGGNAWGEQTGYIDFTGVTIDSDGYFHGYANNPITGQISMNCANTGTCGASDFKVRTSWRTTTASPECSDGVDNDGDTLIDFPNDPGCSSPADDDEDNGSGGGGGGGGGGGPDNPSVIVNDDAPTTTTRAVTLTLFAEDAEDMLLANNERFIGASWQPYATTSPWTLTDGTGEKIVYARFRDDNNRQSDTAQDDIWLLLSGTSSSSASTTLTGVPPTQAELDEIASCHLYLTEFIKRHADNNPAQVVKLQDFLRVYEGFSQVVSSGFYDEVTYNAVHAFQNRFAADILTPWNIQSSTGYVYVTTRDAVNNRYCFHKQQALALRNPITRPFSFSLRLGDTHEDVQRLQHFLNVAGNTVAKENAGSFGNETNYFGPLTKNALGRFQIAQGLVSGPDDPGYGVFGPATHKKVNEISFALD